MKAFQTILLLLITTITCLSQDIPLPEHPNPIKHRQDWINLNGRWDFALDSADIGIQNDWSSGTTDFNLSITVPFPWGSPLSGVEDKADIGWYKRQITIPASWKDKRAFLIIGASDWETHVWLNGKLIGSHQGGYVPIELELNDIEYDTPMTLVIRADDKRRPHTLYGKQGYGNARGIWQTVYLEGRGTQYLEDIHFSPNIDDSTVTVTAYLPNPAKQDTEVIITVKGDNLNQGKTFSFKKDQTKARTVVKIPDPKLWTLNNPFLYEVSVSIGNDQLNSYFGMRKIGVMNLPGTDIPYVSLNNEPIYLQMALDQSYHPEGYYTFPSDQFMIDEINRSKSIGLNGIRTHIKVEIPRKLYWADKLGILVMEDLPNSWGEPEEAMQKESTYTLREMIKRDFNHPSIFSWVLMNETWGLRTNTSDGWKYLPETQKWVESLYHLAKSLDPTRLVEDNSICCGVGHTVTDMNTWHIYLPGYAWDEYLDNLSDNTFEGSGFNYEPGYQQGTEPNFNSECGNVWGYEGSAGDVDYTFDYHRMINSFRTHPKVSGWLYTEHHDVINEWNGYWRFDRSEKETGLSDIVAGMSLNDFHSPFYISTGQEITYEAAPGERVSIPLFFSAMTGQEFDGNLTLEYGFSSYSDLGDNVLYKKVGEKVIDYTPWMQEELEQLAVFAPNFNGLHTIELRVKSPHDEILQRNFVHVITTGNRVLDANVASVPPKEYSDANWSKKLWDVLDCKKVNGAGSGFFEFTIPTENLELNDNASAYFIAELSAKQLFVKDMEDYDSNQDFMLGSVVAPSSNPNSYPMTDETKFPSSVKVFFNGELQSTVELEDDPADHRGILSWHTQPRDRKLREAGSYGYLVKIPIPTEMYTSMQSEGNLTIRLEVEGDGGVAIYGKDFGRYPLDPSIVVE